MPFLLSCNSGKMTTMITNSGGRSSETNSVKMIQNLMRQSDQVKRRSVYLKSTRMLLIISTSFLIFNSPIALAKLYFFLKAKFVYSENENEMADFGEQVIERLTCYIYYFNFTLNFIIYNTTNPKFRNVILKTLQKRCMCFKN